MKNQRWWRFLVVVHTAVSGEEELYQHFSHRQDLELRICKELFPDKVKVLKSKGYLDNQV